MRSQRNTPETHTSKAEAEIFVIESGTNLEHNVRVYGKVNLRLRTVPGAREIQAHWQEVIVSRARTGTTCILVAVRTGGWETEKWLRIPNSFSKSFSIFFPIATIQVCTSGIIQGPQRPAFVALEDEARRGSERMSGEPERGKTISRIYYVIEQIEFI